MIAAIAVFGLGIGLTAPLLSLHLEAHGTDATLNGLNAAVTFVGVIIGAQLTPWWVRRLGLRRFMLACLAIDACQFFLLKIFDDVYVWFPLRLMLGIVGSSLFTASEAWISAIAGDETRGRVIGIYAAVLSAGFAVGPLLLSLTGIEGWAPYILNAVISGIAAIPVLRAGGLAPTFEAATRFGTVTFIRRAPLIAFAVALFGVFETATLSLMPVWGVRVGLSQSLAAASVTAVYFGAIALQVPIGWLSDHVRRIKVLQICAGVSVIGGALLPALGGRPAAIMAVLFIWGGITNGIYAISLSMVGDRFRGPDLVAANAALIVTYGFGSLVGPALGGVAMDLWNPHGMTAAIALVFALFLAASVFVARRKDAAP